jgi:hypothetical protein
LLYKSKEFTTESAEGKRGGFAAKEKRKRYIALRLRKRFGVD